MALEIGGVGESIRQGPTRLMDMEILNGQAYSLVEDDVGEVLRLLYSFLGMALFVKQFLSVLLYHIRGSDVELVNMQLKPEALNALKLPVKVKAGFLGSVRLKVPWSRLGQDPVLVHLDRIFLLAEPATQVEGSSEDAIQEAKKSRIREMETKLLESKRMLETEMIQTYGFNEIEVCLFLAHDESEQ
uniref:Uncharacterized protein n=1 Tax=Solanum lycopersicum TaxID=4081 RepID=A0A3Q7HU81_SOLLC